MDLLISWAILAFSVWASAALVPGVRIGGVKDALVVAAIFGILNWALGFVLFVLIGVGTLGIGFLLTFFTRWVVDAILLKVTDAMTDRLSIRSFGSALLCALFMSAIGTFAQYILLSGRAHHI